MPRVEAPDTERELFEHVLDALDTGLLVLDQDRCVAATNDTLARGRGVDREAVIGLPAGDSRRDDLQDVLKELDRIEQIITDLLLFARPQAGRPVPTDLREIAEKVLDNLARRLEDASIEVERDLDEGLPEVTVDPDMAQQVVLNLVINAIQAMPEGGTLKVGAGLRRTR